MNLTCPHCGNNAFKISTDQKTTTTAECTRCGKAVPFSKDSMTNPPGSKKPRS